MKIKICHFVNIINGRSDGIYQHLKLLLECLDNDRFEQIVVFHGNPKIEKEWERLKVEFYIFPDLSSTIPVKSFLPFFRLMKKKQIDIIHVHTIKPYVIAGITNIFLRKKVIFNYHGVFIQSIYRNIFVRSAYRLLHFIIQYFESVQMVIAPSRSSVNEMISEFGPLAKVKHYYNGTKIRNNGEVQDNAVKFPENKIIVAAVSRLYIEKKIDIALKVIKKITDEGANVYFMIFGDGPLENELKRLSKELNIDDYVCFCGYTQDMASCYSKINVLLNTSDKGEGFPFSIWEAMSFGVPVVASDVGGIREIVEMENCGRVFPIGNINACAASLLEILNNKNLYKTFSENGKNVMQNKYTAESFTKQMESIYIDLFIN